MSVKQIIAYELGCDTCDYVAEQDDSETLVFDTPEAAVEYARDGDWGVDTVPEFKLSCPGCVGA